MRKRVLWGIAPLPQHHPARCRLLLVQDGIYQASQIPRVLLLRSQEFDPL